MDFCPKCGSILLSKRMENKLVLECRKCGYKKNLKTYKPLKIIEKIEKNPLDDVIILEKNEEALPSTKTECPKCGYNEAFWWMRQMRSADEAPTVFFRCKKCKHSWREYG